MVVGVSVPTIRILVFWCIYWGPPPLGNYHFTAPVVFAVRLYMRTSNFGHCFAAPLSTHANFYSTVPRLRGRRTEPLRNMLRTRSSVRSISLQHVATVLPTFFLCPATFDYRATCHSHCCNVSHAGLPKMHTSCLGIPITRIMYFEGRGVLY